MSGITSDAQVCNLAMIMLGEKRVQSISAPANQHERDLATVYAHVRDSELRKNRWRFAQYEQALSADGAYTAPTDSMWLARFALPSTCLRVHLPADRLGWYEVRGRYVYAKAEDTTFLLQFTKSITTVGEWDENFITAVAARIAEVMAEQTTQSSQKTADVREEYAGAIRAARRSNAIETQVEVPAAAGWHVSDLVGGLS